MKQALTLCRLVALLAGAFWLCWSQPGQAQSTDGDEGDGGRAGLTAYERNYTWLELSAGISQTNMTAVAADPTDPRRLYVAAPGRVYASKNGGRSWQVSLIIQGVGTSTRGPGEQRDEREAPFDVDARRQELIDEAVEQRFEELREELLSELESEVDDREFAEELVEGMEQELLDTARTDVLAEELREIEDQLQQELRQARGDTGEARERSRQREEDTSGDSVVDLLVDPNRPRRVYAATGNGLYRSTNRGASWKTIFRGKGGDTRIATSVAISKSAVLVGTRGGLFLSATGGDSWSSFSGELGDDRIIDVDALGDRIYALTEEELFVSRDGGQSWTKRSLPGDLLGTALTSVALSPTEPDDVGIGSHQGVFLSSDAGASITSAGTVGLSSQIVLDVVFHPNWSDLLIIGTEGGVFASTDGRAWTEFHEGLAAPVIRQLAIVHRPPFPVWAVSPVGVFAYVPREKLKARREALDDLRDAWSREPSLATLISAVARYNQLEETDWESWQSRARWQYLAPRLQGSVTMDRFRLEDDRIRTEASITSIQRDRSLRLRPGGLQWQVMAFWDISPLIFNRKEIDVSREIRSLQRDRRELLRRTVRLYARRRILMLKHYLRRDAMSVRERVTSRLEIEETTALLDSLTDAFFSRYRSLQQ